MLKFTIPTQQNNSNDTYLVAGKFRCCHVCLYTQSLKEGHSFYVVSSLVKNFLLKTVFSCSLLRLSLPCFLNFSEFLPDSNLMLHIDMFVIKKRFSISTFLLHSLKVFVVQRITVFRESFLWSTLDDSMKNEPIVLAFKNKIKSWSGKEYTCSIWR